MSIFYIAEKMLGIARRKAVRGGVSVISDEPPDFISSDFVFLCVCEIYID